MTMHTIPNIIAVNAKAWVATVSTGIAPILVDATESFVAGVITVVLGGVATWAVPNRKG